MSSLVTDVGISKRRHFAVASVCIYKHINTEIWYHIICCYQKFTLWNNDNDNLHMISYFIFNLLIDTKNESDS